VENKDEQTPKGFVSDSFNDDPNQEYPLDPIIVRTNRRHHEDKDLLSHDVHHKSYPVKISKTLSNSKGVLVRIKRFKDAP
jgi:hypothetical protein